MKSRDKPLIEVYKDFHGQPLAETLLTPTRIYVKPLLKLMKSIDIKALSHITGGGLLENIPRVLPDFTEASINTTHWAMPEIFDWLKTHGNIEATEMYRTFNCGIGMVICVAKKDAEQAQQILEAEGETVVAIGEIKTSQQQNPEVTLRF